MAIFHQDIFVIPATPEQVREFIMTPERIADYFPDTYEAGSLNPGTDVWIKAKSGISILKLIPEKCTDDMLTMDVFSATMHEPFTLESIKENVIMSMVEDWFTEPVEGGTKLTKIWRNLQQFGPLERVPMLEGIIEVADEERPKIIELWGKAAREQG